MTRRNGPTGRLTQLHSGCAVPPGAAIPYRAAGTRTAPEPRPERRDENFWGSRSTRRAQGVQPGWHAVRAAGGPGADRRREPARGAGPGPLRRADPATCDRSARAGGPRGEQVIDRRAGDAQVIGGGLEVPRVRAQRGDQLRLGDRCPSAPGHRRRLRRGHVHELVRGHGHRRRVGIELGGEPRRELQVHWPRLPITSWRARRMEQRRLGSPVSPVSSTRRSMACTPGSRSACGPRGRPHAAPAPRRGSPRGRSTGARDRENRELLHGCQMLPRLVMAASRERLACDAMTSP